MSIYIHIYIYIYIYIYILYISITPVSYGDWYEHSVPKLQALAISRARMWVI